MNDKIDQMWNSVEGLREGLTLAARAVERLTRERDEAREQWFRRGQQAAFVRAADVSGQRFLRNLPLHGAPTEEEWARFLAGVAHENVKPLVEEEMRAINYEQPLGPTRLDTAGLEVAARVRSLMDEVQAENARARKAEAEVERLTQERDEARAAIDYAMSERAAMEHERDALKVRLETALAKGEP